MHSKSPELLAARRRIRRLGGCLLVVVLAAACGSAVAHRRAGRSAAAHRQPVPVLDGCVALTSGARAVVLHARGAMVPTVRGVLLGDGKTTFVLSNESDEPLCSWLPFAGTLRAHGYSVLLYDYLDPADLPADVTAGAATAHAFGARQVVLMGASVGARASIQAAAKHLRGVTAVVTLSAELTVASDTANLLGAARHVTVPTLLVAAADDPMIEGDTGGLLRALASRRKQSLVVPGLDHGTALLGDTSGHRVRSTILAFVAGGSASSPR